MLYKAFVSYSHSADAKLAAAVQSALQRFAKPWYRLRAIRIFRDKTNLAAAPALWSSIQTALRESEFFLLLASPRAAASPWVQKEVEFWLTQRTPETLLIVLTDGAIRWDGVRGDFDWTVTNALPPRLAGAFREEPLFVELPADNFSPKSPAFVEAVAALAATLHGRPKDELTGEEVRQQRRTLRLAWSAVFVLILLTLIAVLAGWRAVREAEEAKRQARRFLAGKLAAESRLLVQTVPKRSMLLAVEAARISGETDAQPPPAIEEALREAVRAANGVALGYLNEPVRAVEISSKGLSVVALGERAELRAWKLKAPGVPMPALNFPGDCARIIGLTLSRDGQWLATSCEDASVRLWSFSEETSSPLLLPGPTAAITDLAFSPDGSQLAGASPDGAVLIWSIPAVAPPLVLGSAAEWPEGWHSKEISHVEFLPNGKQLVGGGASEAAFLWNLTSDPGRRPTVLKPPTPGDPIQCLSISPDGQWAFGGTRFLTGFLFALNASNAPAPPQRVDSWEKAGATAAAFSPNGSLLAVAHSQTDAMSVSVLPLSTTESERRPILQSVGGEGVAFSGDGEWLLAASRDHAIRAWPARRLQGAPLMLYGHDAPLRALAVRGPRWCVSGAADGSVHLWDLSKLRYGEEPRWRIARTESNPQGRFEFARSYHLPSNLSWAFSRDGRRLKHLVSRAPFGRHLVSDLDIRGRGEDDLAHSFEDRERDPVALSPDGDWLVVSENDPAHIWSLAENRLACTIPMPPAVPGVSAINIGGGGRFAWVFSADHRWLASKNSGRIFLWDLASETKERLQLADGQHASLPLFSPDNRWFLFSAAAGIIEARDLSKANREAHRFEIDAVGRNATDVAFSADGRWFAVADDRGKVELCDLRASPVASKKHSVQLPMTEAPGPVCIALSSDGRWLAAGGRNDAALVWSRDNAGTPSPPISLPGHEQGVTALAMDPAGRFVITASARPDLRLWRLDRKTAPEPVELRGASDHIVNLLISRGSEWLAAETHYGRIYVWSLSLEDLLARARRFAGRELSVREWDQHLSGEPYR